ncbi:TRM11 family SAM-dependent methyltransferase [Naumannella huperziae]
MRYAMLLSPSANRAYGESVAELAAAELEICRPEAREVHTRAIGGVDYLIFDLEDVPTRLSGTFAMFALLPDDLLRPVTLERDGVLDEDLVTIPKYQGKTNEQFTRLLLDVTLAAVDRPPGPRSVLDPMCGRGTTLTTAWRAGHDAAGVEADPKSVEQFSAFLRTWLRRKRLKHRVEQVPVRREGRSLGKKLEATVRPEGTRELSLTVFTGDTRDSAALFGKRRFDAVVVDAPYGVVHGSSTGRDRERSPATLLGEAVGVWAGQLRAGGALGISWNTHGLRREDLAGLVAAAGLEPQDHGPWRRLAHRVDASIRRDVLVARKA